MGEIGGLTQGRGYNPPRPLQGANHTPLHCLWPAFSGRKGMHSTECPL